MMLKKCVLVLWLSYSSRNVRFIDGIVIRFVIDVVSVFYMMIGSWLIDILCVCICSSVMMKFVVLLVVEMLSRIILSV